MESEIIKILNLKLIPDLVNIINDYTLTPYQYFKLIDDKKYTTQEYQKYREEYQCYIANVILKNFNTEYHTNYNSVINDIIAESKTLKFYPELTNFTKEKITKISLKSANEIFTRYITKLIVALNIARIFNVKNSNEDSDDLYYLSGYQYSYDFLDVPLNTKIKITARPMFGRYSLQIGELRNGRIASPSLLKNSLLDLFAVYSTILYTYTSSKSEILQKIKKM